MNYNDKSLQFFKNTLLGGGFKFFWTIFWGWDFVLTLTACTRSLTPFYKVSDNQVLAKMDPDSTSWTDSNKQKYNGDTVDFRYVHKQPIGIK